MNFISVFCYCSVITAAVSADKFELRDNSLNAPYTGGWTSYGATVFTPSYVRLTGDRRGAISGISNVYPLYSRDWEVVIDFRVHGSTGSLFGDGFAFWYIDGPIKKGRALGASETFRGLGVFFDTYSNHNGEHGHEHPYVSAMVNNGTITYDHDTDGTLTQLAGCHAPFRNKNHKTKALISYARDTLKVLIDVKGENKWSPCFEVNGVHLPTGFYLGLSAATGDLTDTHDIFSVKTHDLGLTYTNEENLVDRSSIVPSADSAEPFRDHVPDTERTSLWTIFFYIFLFIFVAAICVFAFICYQTNQRRKKRLF